MIRCAVFDFDNTLVKSTAHRKQAYLETVAHLDGGHDKLTEILENHAPDQCQNIIEQLATWAAKGKKPDVEPLQKEFGKNYAEKIERKLAVCTEVRGAGHTLQSLKSAGLTLYLNATCPERSLRRMIVMRGWGNLFEDMLGHTGNKYANLCNIAADERLKPEEIVMIGDMESDRDAAETFGCAFIGLNAHTSNFSKQPKHLAQDMTGVSLIIQDMM